MTTPEAQPGPDGVRPSAPAARRSTLADYHARLTRVLRHIQANLDQELSTETLAKAACFSGDHFQRIFLGMLGETAGGFVRRIRLERAAVELRAASAGTDAGNAGLGDIARRAGYGSQEAFTRAFRDAFGMTPGAYRDADAVGRWPGVPSGVHYGQHLWTPIFVRYQELGMLQSAQIETLADIRAAAMTHRGAYHQIGAVFGRLFAWAGPRGLDGPHVRCIGVYYHDPRATPEDQLRSHACLEVGPGVQSDPAHGVEIITIPGGRFGVGVFKGHYSKLEEAWVWMTGQWVPTNGHEIDDRPSFEVYLNDPKDTAPDDLLTAIYVPIV